MRVQCFLLRYHTWFDGLAFIAITAKIRSIKLPGVSVSHHATSDLDPLLPDSDCSFDRPQKYILIVGPHANIRSLVNQVNQTASECVKCLLECGLI